MSRFTIIGQAAALLAEAAGSSARALWSDQRGLSGTARIALSGDRVLMVDEMGGDIDGRVRVVFVLHDVPFFIECDVRRGRLVGPISLWSEEQRKQRRFSMDGDLTWWTVTADGMRAHRASLVDVGVQGVRVHVRAGSPMPPMRARFPVRVRIGGQTYDALAETRNRTTDDQGGALLGLRVDFRRHRTALAKLCVETAVPRMRLRRDVEGDAVCRLFARSGYLDLRDGCTPSAAWLGIDEDDISRDFVYLADDGEPIGHVSVTRAYGRTWLGHQIAMKRRHPQMMQARAGLYAAFTMLPTLIDGEAAHLLGYYDLELPWHQLFFTHFANSVSSPDTAAVVPWDRFERRADVPLPEAPTFAGAVTPIRVEDAPLLTQLARSLVPTLMGDALDFHPQSLISDTLHPAYGESQAHRARTGFCLREHGRITAFALCEVTDRQLSLFNIMNMAQVFALPAASESGQLALQRAVRAFYRDRGIKDALVIAPAGTFQGTLDPDVRLEETMGCIVWSSAGLRAYENFLQLHFEWLSQGRRVMLPSNTNGLLAEAG